MEHGLTGRRALKAKNGLSLSFPCLLFVVGVGLWLCHTVPGLSTASKPDRSYLPVITSSSSFTIKVSGTLSTFLRGFGLGVAFAASGSGDFDADKNSSNIVRSADGLKSNRTTEASLPDPLTCSLIANPWPNLGCFTRPNILHSRLPVQAAVIRCTRWQL